MSTTTPARLEHSGNDDGAQSDESTTETDETDECACSELREGFPCADCYINGDADVTPISGVES